MNKAYLRKSVLRICQQPRTFEYISKNTKGLYPNYLTDILRELGDEDLITYVNDMWVVKQIKVDDDKLQLFPPESKLYLQKYMGYFDFLKTPHPLDFEWRNSTASLNRLLNKIQTFLLPKDKLLFLGMPTLFATAIQKDIPYVTSLIERNKPIITGLNKIHNGSNKFRIIEADLFRINPEIIAEHFCVVMDPPWYTPHFKQFMWVAAKSICLNGMVAISLPPINTRPNILEERLEWFTFCQTLGLCLEILEPEQLEYAMPFFEFNALRANGIQDVMPFWRKGDLAIFRKIGNTDLPRPNHESINSEWVEREFNSIRLRIKTNHNSASVNPNSIPLIIESIVKGDILPTVSNRDERRNEANLWTSGNRIFKVNDPFVFLSCLDSVLSGTNITENENLVTDFIAVVIKIENSEYKEYLEWIYYEMERQIN